MTTTTATLSSWLLSQIETDEAAARAATDRDEFGERRTFYSHFGVGRDDWGVHYFNVDPAHVLAVCKAHRAIVEAVEKWRHAVVEDCWYTCAAATEERDGGECCVDGRRGTGCDCGRDFRANAILAPLATAYADRPGFRDEWRL